MRTKTTLRIGLAIVLLLGACSDPEPGSRGDLEAQIEAIEVPSGISELGRSYTEECAATCPILAVWYEGTGPVEEMRTQLFDAVTEAGWDVEDASATDEVYTGRTEDHILFVTTNEELIAANPNAPTGTTAELSIHVLDEAGDP